MKNLGLIACAYLCLTFSFMHTTAQTDDVRQATGLPIPIGAPVIYGQVKLRGIKASDPRPMINVSLVVGGGTVDRMPTNDRGYYYFLRSPGDGATILFELDNNEVGRVVLTADLGSSVRRDIEIEYSATKSASLSSPGVISARGSYVRSPEAEKVFDAAMIAVRAKKPDEAIGLFKQISEKDPKDFVALTELGTLYFSGSKPDEATAAYGKALALKPDFLPAQLNLGKLRMSQKRYDDAITVLLAAASSHADCPEVFQYLGESFLQAKQGSKAVMALNEAIRLAPVAKAEIHLRIATLYNAAGAKDRAAAEYKLFLAKVPDYAKKADLEKYILENLK